MQTKKCCSPVVVKWRVFNCDPKIINQLLPLVQSKTKTRLQPYKEAPPLNILI